jgi:hypothetical protein
VSFRWLIVLVVASCHRHAPAVPDAPGTADALADALSGPDAFSGPVTITVTHDGAPDIGIPVVYQAVDGTVTATVMTDASGTATGMVPTGGIVTVIQTESGTLSTYIGVQPPEQLTLVDYNAAQPKQTVAVTAPTDPGANGYGFNFACGGPGFTTSDLPLACGAADDVLVRAQDNQGYIGAFVALDVPIVNGMMSIPGTYMPMTTQTFAVTNSLTTSNVMFGASIPSTRGLMNYRNGQIPITGGSGTASTTDGFVASGVNEAVVVTAILQPFSGRFSQLVTSIGPSADSFTLDLDSALLPNMTTPPSYHFATHKVLWVPTGGAQTPDALFAMLYVTRGSQVWQWNIAAPYVAGELALPTLPTVLGVDYNATTGDLVNITIEQVRVPGGYAAIRPNGLSTIDDGIVGGLFAFHIDATVPSQSVTATWSP